MGITKQKLVRLKMLDKLLSNRYHNYSTEDIADKVSDKMAELDPSSDGVVVRTIQKDIKFLREEWPVFVDIEEYTVSAYSREKQKTYTKHCIRYADPSFSIFTKDLTDDEEYLLSEAMSLLGQFDGLPNLDALEGIRLGLGVKRNDKKIISFTKNPLENSNVLGELFTCISQKQVIELHYHKFTTPDDKLKINLIPYMLKEYNRRWYLFAAAEENCKILCFALDRIDEIIPLPSHKYVEYAGDINNRFDYIIGVTDYDVSPIYDIYFWVSDDSVDYVATKPLHKSQESVSEKDEKTLREKYSSLSGGRFFSIKCKYNYELIRELTSFGANLIVLEPSDIVDEVQKRVNQMYVAYSSINKENNTF